MSRKPFAVVLKSTDTFITMESAKNKVELLSRYPSDTYGLFSMKGKDDIPKKEGAFISDLTIDPETGEWNWKLTDSEIAARVKDRKASMIRSKLIKLKTDEEKAVSLGPDFAGEATRITTKITELERELAGL